jgi:hypothetical protein
MQRTESQAIGDAGEELFGYLVARSRAWIPRKLPKDFGIDYEIELASPSVSGQIIRCQIKTVTRTPDTLALHKIALPVALLEYAETCRVPVIVVLMDLEGARGWFLWLQSWLLENRVQPRRLKQDSLTIEFPAKNDLLTGLDQSLRSIARWETSTQVTLGLLDCARVAAFSGNAEVVAKTAALIKDASHLLGEGGLRIIIDAVIALGESSWRSHSGWEISQSLFSFCREAGDLFTREQIIALAVRPEAYSRTGVSALGLLYHRFPEHTQSLRLAEAFKATDDIPLWYYCKLRERYIGQSFLEFVFKADTHFEIDGYTVSVDERDIWLDKWANRGDSFLLQRIYKI